MMKSISIIIGILYILIGLTISPAIASIISTGDVIPEMNYSGDADVRNLATFVGVGDYFTGTLTIDNGSVLTSGGDGGYLGVHDPHANGIVTVNGENTEWRIVEGSLAVGHQGAGELNITNNAIVSVTDVVTDWNSYIATFAGANGLLNVSNNAELNLFQDLNIAPGIIIEEDDIGIPDEPCIGILNVDSGGVVEIAGLSIGIGQATDSYGYLNISDGGKVNSSELVNVGGGYFDSESIVTVTGEDSELRSDTLVRIGIVDESSTGMGKVILSESGTLWAPTIGIGRNGSLFGNGTINGDMTNGGLIAPGLSTGLLTVIGSFDHWSFGNLEIEIASSVESDLLDVSQAVNLWTGGLSVKLIGGFEPEVGESFEIITGGSISGEFDPNKTILPKFSGRTFMVTYDENSVILEVVYDQSISSILNFHPETINLKSRGNWITCYIELPDGYDVNLISIPTVVLDVNGFSIDALITPTDVGDYDNDGIPDLMVKFDRQAVQSSIMTGSVEMVVSGSLEGLTTFQGSDTVVVIDKGKEHIDEGNPSSIVN